MQNTSSYDEADASWQALNKLMEDPKFQRIVVEIGSLPKAEQLLAIFTRLAPQALVAEGLEVPEGYSITTDVSWQPADPATSTANFAATGQNALDRSVPQFIAMACVKVPGTNKCKAIPVPPGS